MMADDIPGAGPEGALARAKTLQSENRLTEAESAYAAVISESPNHAGALLSFGILRLQQGRAQDAAILLRRAVDGDPNSGEALTHLGVALSALGSPDEARDCQLKAVARFEAQLADEPYVALRELGLASALAALGRHEEAFVRLRNAASADPGLAPKLQQALNLYAQGHPNEAQAGMQRLNRYIGSFLTNFNSARMGVYPGLTSTAFHDPSRLPGAIALEREYAAIRAEIEGLAAAEFQEEAEGLKGRGAWDVFLFYERGKKNTENCSRCPTITRIIESTNTVRSMAGLLYVSKLSPGTDIKAHRGPINLRLRCHLGIKVPEGDCGLKVGGETRKWQEGKCLVFDDSLEHEAWNHTKEPRVVLILDFWHPDLTPAEVAYLEGLHRFANFHATSLNKYWSANAASKSKARTTDD